MELQEKLKEYAEAFGEGFPMFPLGWDKEDDEIIALIDKCLKAHKTAYELGLIKEVDVGVMY